MDPFMLSGTVATILHIMGNAPMVWKVCRTRSVDSYSYSYLLLRNASNAFQWLYVISLPLGPIYVLHSFYTAVMAIMMGLYLRYQWGGGR